jgi:uncharacterized protein
VVNLADDFWKPRRRINRDVTLPSRYGHLEDTGRLDNFRRASVKIGGEYQGIYFNDSDVYKWLEGALWALAEGPDPDLEHMVDTAITEVEDAQQPDGYPNLLGGVAVLQAEARSATPGAGWEDRL